MDYHKIYNQIINRAKNRKLEGYTESHHIIPRCVGGGDFKDNLVILTAREHFLCHMLLCEIYPNENKLKHALFLMAIGKQKTKNLQYYVGARTYERLKIEYSKMLTGTPQSEETKMKKSKTMKKIWASKSEKEMSRIGVKRAITRKKNNPKWHTEEWKEKVSQSLKGKDNTKANQSRSKPVLQFDLDGNFIQEFPSISEAERVVGGDIKGMLVGRSKTAGGYVWKYKD